MGGLSRNLRRMSYDLAELPGISWLARPLYRQMFMRDVLPGNSYCGAYATFDEARANAPKTGATSFDVPESGDLYPDHLGGVRVSDYPVIFWLDQLFRSGLRSLFDLGGNIGTSYYGFQHHLVYPDDLRWQVHDVPAVLAAGREWASRNDVEGKLGFTSSCDDADGCDMLLCSGVLQYLDFSLPDMLRKLKHPPGHLLINLTPLHPSRTFVTLQRVTRQGVGIASCPYTVTAVAQFIDAFRQSGYAVVDHWESLERHMRVPFEPSLSIDRYHGFYLKRD